MPRPHTSPRSEAPVVTPFSGILLHCIPPGLSRHQLVLPGGLGHRLVTVVPACLVEEAAVPVGGPPSPAHTSIPCIRLRPPPPPSVLWGPSPPDSELPKLRIRPMGTVLGSETLRPDSDPTEERKFALTVAQLRLGHTVWSGSFLPLGLRSHRGMEWGHGAEASGDEESFRVPFRGSPSEDAWEGGQGARREFR